jgi:5-methyltetrahydrofolate--homocysteine methyltransferase
MDGQKERIYQGILEGDVESVETGVAACLLEDTPAAELLNGVMIPAMTEVGRLFEADEYFVPEMLIAARAMQAGLALLRPHLVKEKVEPLGRVAIGTVSGDLHDIGKSLVVMMVEGVGFEVIDLGVDVEPQTFVRAVADRGCSIVGMSALLTTTMPAMKETIDAVQEAGLRQKVKIVVGGAPVTQRFADEIGADGYAKDAAAAARLVKGLVAP